MTYNGWCAIKSILTKPQNVLKRFQHNSFLLSYLFLCYNRLYFAFFKNNINNNNNNNSSNNNNNNDNNNSGDSGVYFSMILFDV